MEDGSFDLSAFATELDAAAANREVGTRMLLENERVRIWDLDLPPGERLSFHCHVTPYFFVCVDEGRGLSRFPNGTSITMDYAEGDTWFDEVTAGSEIHDLENVGTTRLRFTTVELIA
jgi:beta-alanine degradation protein BauB